MLNGVPERPSDVRRQFQRIRPLAELGVEERGWTLDVLTAVRSLGKREFAAKDMNAKIKDLSRLHPNNHHVREKIRQQLQVLRDKGFVEFLERGNYRLR
jgi:type II restriction enzyme